MVLLYPSPRCLQAFGRMSSTQDKEYIFKVGGDLRDQRSQSAAEAAGDQHDRNETCPDAEQERNTFPRSELTCSSEQKDIVRPRQKCGCTGICDKRKIDINRHEDLLSEKTVACSHSVCHKTIDMSEVSVI